MPEELSNNSNNQYILSLYEKLEDKIDTAPVSELLPMFRRLCNKIGLTQLEEWARLETEGYPPGSQIPDYRTIKVVYTFSGNVLIYRDHPELKSRELIDMRDAVKELEIFSETNELIHFQDSVDLKEGIRVFLAIYPLSFQQILTSVRSKLNELFLQIDISKLLNHNGAKEIKTIPLNLSGLHPKVQEVSGSLFENGHYRNAILDAYIALEEEIKNKSDTTGVTTGLMEFVFSKNNPKLVVSDDPDERLGFMWLFAGAMMGIRNPKAHRLILQDDPQRALEWLAFASVLFRVVDDSMIHQK